MDLWGILKGVVDYSNIVTIANCYVVRLRIIVYWGIFFGVVISTASIPSSFGIVMMPTYSGDDGVLFVEFGVTDTGVKRSGNSVMDDVELSSCSRGSVSIGGGPSLLSIKLYSCLAYGSSFCLL